MSQMSFGDAEYAGKRKKTRREVFLEEMDQVVPCEFGVRAVIEFGVIEFGVRAVIIATVGLPSRQHSAGDNYGSDPKLYPNIAALTPDTLVKLACGSDTELLRSR